MKAYEPSSRRPIADIFRLTAHAVVRWCVRRGIHPDTVSYASVVASGTAAICFWQAGRVPALLIPAAVFCYFRLWLNMLDGMVALASGKASLRGEILNEVPDRISDVIIFVGVAHSGLCSPFSGYWTAILSLFVAYVGIFGQAVGVQREFSGLMSKQWRMVALHLGSWILLAVHWMNRHTIPTSGLTILDLTLLLIIAGCVQTIVIRLRCILRALREKESPASSENSPL